MEREHRTRTLPRSIGAYSPAPRLLNRSARAGPSAAMSLEVQASRGYGDESQGLVESGAVLPVNTAPKKKVEDQDDEGLLPVILEQYLEKAGVM